jgi:nitrite reductase/ring-hydroxylating ferredoxin subunit
LGVSTSSTILAVANSRSVRVTGLFAVLSSVFAYQNFCAHVGHPLNWSPNKFLTRDQSAIICASHGATYEIETGRCFAGPGAGRSLRQVDLSVRDGVIYVTGPTSM